MVISLMQACPVQQTTKTDTTKSNKQHQLLLLPESTLSSSSYGKSSSANDIMISSNISSSSNSSNKSFNNDRHIQYSDDNGCCYNNTNDDSEIVVLRTKQNYSNLTSTTTANSTITSSSAVTYTGAVAATNKNKQHHFMDRSFSIPMDEPTDGQLLTDGVNNIDRIRSFLESDYLPNEFWHLQRDSFIHRSYNEKLLARKNENDYPKRPISVPPPSTTATNIVDTTIHNNSSSKRDSFIRHSLNTIRRSFHKSVKKKNGTIVTKIDRNIIEQFDDDVTETVAATFAAAASVATGGAKKHSDKIKKSKSAENVLLLNLPIENVKKLGHSRNNSTSTCTTNNR